MSADQVYAKYKSGVFQIFGRAAGPEDATEIGTGFIHDVGEEMGITNAHVVHGVTALKARLADGSVVPLHVMATDPCTDLAVVHFGDPLPAGTARLPIGDSDSARPGQPVVVMGFPGSLAPDFTNQPLQITEGIVAAANVPADPGGEEPALTKTIQHTAAVNPGNSGGPLFDDKGNVIGINTLANTESTDQRAVQGQYYAISIKDAHAEVEKLMTGKSQNDVGWTLKPYGEIPLKDYFAALGLGDEKAAQSAETYLIQHGIKGGLWVMGMTPGSSVERSKLIRYDLLTEVNETSVDSMTQVCDIVESTLPGTTMSAQAVHFLPAGRPPLIYTVEFKMPGGH